jgi:hypothetical protein
MNKTGYILESEAKLLVDGRPGEALCLANLR